MEQDVKTTLNEICSRHPQENNVCFCVECEEVTCFQCVLDGRNGGHFKHEYTRFLDGKLKVKLRLTTIAEALIQLVHDAKFRCNNHSRLQKTITKDTVDVINRINQSINDVIKELECVRTNLITNALRNAQNSCSTSVQKFAALTNLYVRRSASQSLKRLQEVADCTLVAQQLPVAKQVEKKQQELQRLAQCQQQCSEDWQMSEANAQTQTQTGVREHWMQEMEVMQDYVGRLRLYTNTLVESRRSTQESEVTSSILNHCFNLHRNELYLIYFSKENTNI